MSDIKPLKTSSNIGDTLSAIQFNFTCLDIKLCNLQTEAERKWNNILIDGDWESSFLETLQMSANWETTKQQVHSASAFWDFKDCTIYYPNVFPGGRANPEQVTAWMNSNFPASQYSDGQVFHVYFLEWYSNPALHDPPAASITKFGAMTLSNNVHVRNVNWATYKKEDGVWVYSTTLHFPKDCREDVCDPCWGDMHYPDHPYCLPDPTYYKLSCYGVEVEEVTATLSGCEFLATPPEYDFTPSTLLTDVVYQQISSTNLSPYTIGEENSFNPHLDSVGSNAYTKYIRESPQPLVDENTIDRISGFALQFNYDYNGTIFTNASTFSSDDIGDFSLSADMVFPFEFSDSLLKSYFVANGQTTLLNPTSGTCPFRVQIDTIWYRWVMGNSTLSGSPYWHIGAEPFDPSLGFVFDPESGVPDTASEWTSAAETLGMSGLSAYFGTYVDMMGNIDDIKVFALT